MSTRSPLQALVQHYQDLAALDKIEQPGWGSAKISYAVELNPDGTIAQLICVKTEQKKGKKTVLQPQIMSVPESGTRSSGVRANFLCDNSAYFFGCSNKGKPERDLKCFAAAKELHQKLLSDEEHPAVNALLRFFESWQPEQTRTHPVFQSEQDELFSTANFVFRFQGEYLQDIPAVRNAWLKEYNTAGEGEPTICLITGETAEPAILHPQFKGIRDAQSSGAALVSYNAPAFWSYGKEYGMNAPTSKFAAFAYGAALRHLLADKEHMHYIGDTAMVCWAEGGETVYQDIFGDLLCEDSSYEEKDYRRMAADLAKGHPFSFEESMVDPQRAFYVLGIAPNAARLSIRFFLCGSFGAMLKNILEHHARLAIIRPSFDQQETLSVWRLLNETVNQKASDKKASPILAGELLRAILSNGRYPASLLNGVVLRIRADHTMNRNRAAIIKAYYLKNKHPDVPEEVLQVSLNENSSNTAYNLGRLFSVLEDIQATANPGINATIRDKYFSSAAATPAHIFPTLMNLAQKHLKKLSTGTKIYMEKQLQAIIDTLGEEYPVRMSLPQQGAFQIGYYHQTQARFAGKKKEDTENE